MMQKYKLKRPDKGELYRYVMIEHEHESDNLFPEEHEVNVRLYYNWIYRAATEGLNVSLCDLQWSHLVTKDILFSL